jgi:acyl-coenzyme A synthetase/AMP-(fatty) acid ligase
MTFEPRTGARSLAWWAHRTPHAIAVAEADYRYSYADMAALVVRMTKHLSAAGLTPGSIAGIECSSRYVHLVLILACECLGLATTSFVAQELVGDTELLSRCTVLYAEAPCQRPRTVPLTMELIVSIAQIPITPDDFGVLDYRPAPGTGGRIVKTSGTTGRQKCMRNDPAGIQRALTVTEEILNLQGGSRNFLCLYPFSFRPSYTDSVLALNAGRTVVFAGINTFYRDLAALGDCHAVILPADAAALIADFPGPTAAYCVVQINGGSLTTKLHRDLLATFASSVCNTYSTNETNYVALLDEHGAGALLPGVEVRIAGDDGRDQPPGEAGVIMVRSTRMVPFYLWDDALTARYFIDGWHVTGDLGFQPARDSLVVLGRADDMLNIGGIKLPPQPIEAELRTVEGVRDAVLLGIENDLGLTELHVVIERSGRGRDAGLTELIRPVVHRYGRDFVAHFRDSLLRTDTGKVRRGALRASIVAGHD